MGQLLASGTTGRAAASDTPVFVLVPESMGDLIVAPALGIIVAGHWYAYLKGFMLYRREDFVGAVAAWQVYLEVGEFHPAAVMVRPLYAEARRRLGAR